MINKVQKIRKGIEKLKSHLIRGACSSQIAMETRCKEEAYNEVLAILDTVQEEPVSEDFKEFEVEYIEREKDNIVCVYDRHAGLVDGAKWQAEQMMANAVDGAFIRRNRYTKKNVLNGLDMTCDAIQRFKDKDKIKVLFIKEE